MRYLLFECPSRCFPQTRILLSEIYTQSTQFTPSAQTQPWLPSSTHHLPALLPIFTTLKCCRISKASIFFGWRIQMKMSPRLCVFLPNFPVCRFLYSSWVCDFQEKHIIMPVLGCLPVAHFCHPRYRNRTSPTVGRNVSRNCVERIVSLVSRLKTEDWQHSASLLLHCISITQELGEFGLV